MEARKNTGAQTVWDGRFIIEGGESLEVGALGETGLSALRKDNISFPALDNLPFKVKKTLPALWQGQNLLAIPHLGWVSAMAPAAAKGIRVSARNGL
jgi:hypothetical protein